MVYHVAYLGRHIWLHDPQTVYRSLPTPFQAPHAAFNEIALRLRRKSHSPPSIDMPISPRLPALNSSQLHPILDSSRPSHRGAPHHAPPSLDPKQATQPLPRPLPDCCHPTTNTPTLTPTPSAITDRRATRPDRTGPDRDQPICAPGPIPRTAHRRDGALWFWRLVLVAWGRSRREY